MYTKCQRTNLNGAPRRRKRFLRHAHTHTSLPIYNNNNNNDNDNDNNNNNDMCDILLCVSRIYNNII